MFKLNDADFVKVWEVFRKNKFLFVFRHGCLMWAMPTYLLGLIFSIAIWDDKPITLQKIVIGTVVFMLAGLIMGFMVYNTNEKRFNLLTSNKS